MNVKTFLFESYITYLFNYFALTYTHNQFSLNCRYQFSGRKTCKYIVIIILFKNVVHRAVSFV